MPGRSAPDSPIRGAANSGPARDRVVLNEDFLQGPSPIVEAEPCTEAAPQAGPWHDIASTIIGDWAPTLRVLVLAIVLLVGVIVLAVVTISAACGAYLAFLATVLHIVKLRLTRSIRA